MFFPKSLSMYVHILLNVRRLAANNFFIYCSCRWFHAMMLFFAEGFQNLALPLFCRRVKVLTSYNFKFDFSVVRRKRSHICGKHFPRTFFGPWLRFWSRSGNSDLTANFKYQPPHRRRSWHMLLSVSWPKTDKVDITAAVDWSPLFLPVEFKLYENTFIP